jgi:HK97 family phage major capsid protein
MPTYNQTAEQMRAAGRRRRAAVEAAAERENAEISAIIGQARAEGRSHLTADEDARADTLLGQRDAHRQSLAALDAELGTLDAAIAEDEEIRAGQAATRRNPLYATVRTATRADRPLYDRVLRVGYEARTYRPDTDPHGIGFLRDVASNWLHRDPGAGERLSRHLAEERVERPGMAERAAGDSTTANWAGLTVPQYLTDMVAPAVANLRPLADHATAHDLPPAGMTVNISLVTTPTQVALVGSELPAGGVAAQSIDDTLLTENVQTFAGQVTLSRQAIDRGTGIEDTTMLDLARRYAASLDSTMINQAATGITNTAQTTTLSGATTAQQLYTAIYQANSLLEQALAGVASPDYVVMHSRRWNWMASTIGSTWPLIGGANVPAQQAAIIPVGGNEYGSGVRAILPNGLKVIVDNNVPTNLGASTNQDEVYVVASQEVHLWEDPATAGGTYIRAEQPKAAQLGVLLVLYGYAAYTVRRYTNNPGKLAGSGLVAPAGF